MRARHSSQDDEDAELTAPSAAALQELVTVPAGYSAILHGGVDSLVALLNSSEAEAVKTAALGIVQYLASTGDGQRVLGRNAAAPPLVRLAVNAESASAQATARRILCDLAKEPTALSNLIAAGTVAVLVGQLKSTQTAHDQESALAALAQLSGARREAPDGSLVWAGGQEALARDSAAPPLVALLQSGSVRAQQHAMLTLHNLARCAETRSALAPVEGAVGACVQVSANAVASS